MPETIIVIACLLAGFIAGALLVWLTRPKAAGPDTTAIEGFARLNERIDAMGSWLHKTQGQLQQTMHERLDAATTRTTDHLRELHERLAVIDSAQKNITDLASQVTTLQQVLGNKQSRGAFGQGQMETIIKDRLPKDCYDFQATLSNRHRPDCCIYLPGSPSLVIDAKFPLEAVTAFRDAKSEDEKKLAMARVRQDVGKHVAGNATVGVAAVEPNGVGVADMAHDVAAEKQIPGAMELGRSGFPSAFGILPADPLDEIVLDEGILRPHSSNSFDAAVANRVPADDV